MAADKPDLSRATPRPWQVTPRELTGKGLAFLEKDDEIIATFHNQYDAEIVRQSVNNYDRLRSINAALVAALRDAPNPAKYNGRPGVEQFFEDYDIWRHKQRAALKLAKESNA